LRADRRLRLALGVLCRYRAGIAAVADPPWYGRARTFSGSARAAALAERASPRRQCRGARIPPLRAAAIVQQSVALQHARRPAVCPRHIAGDLDHGDLAADDPESDA